MIDARLERALLSLDGLSVGDAFGEQFWGADFEQRLVERSVPPAPWPYTDDTEMALSVVARLCLDGRIDQDRLAQSFAAHYDNSRGYGPSMHRVLLALGDGRDWRVVVRESFGGLGSWGNGAAMRAGPLGAFFADDLALVVEQASRSAEVTHAHAEAIAGAVAVAVAAAVASGAQPRKPAEFLDAVLPHVPASEVRDKLRHARDLPTTASVRLAVAALGNGTELSAQDTVPFALWCAAQHLDDYAEALWLTVSGEGDRDTTSAIAGSIVVLRAGRAGIPQEWLAARESLPDWLLA